jgi:hypothetical protein
MENVPPPITSVAPPIRGSDKLWTVFSHLSWFVGVPFLLPLVVYLVMKNDSPYVAENAREALNFHISVLIYLLCCWPLMLIIIGIPLAAVIFVAALVLGVVAAVKASDGESYRYPFTLRLV